MSKHLALTLTTSLGWIVPFVGIGATIGAGAALAAMKPPSPTNPVKAEAERVNLKRFSGQAGREGSGSTLLTGQSGVTGQPKVNRPTLLGG